MNKCITWKITISITQPCTSQILSMLVKEAKIEDSSLWRYCLNVIPTFPERMLYNSTGIPITSMCQGRGPNFRLVNYANSRTRHLEWKPGDVISVWEVLYRNIWIFNLLIWFDVYKTSTAKLSDLFLSLQHHVHHSHSIIWTQNNCNGFEE